MSGQENAEAEQLAGGGSGIAGKGEKIQCRTSAQRRGNQGAVESGILRMTVQPSEQ